MCVQDVRIGRNLSTKTVVLNSLAATDVEALGPNAARVSLVIIQLTGAPTANSQLVSVTTGKSGTGDAIAAISNMQPMAVASIYTHGTAVLGSVWVHFAGAQVANIMVTETFLQEPIDKIAKSTGEL